MVLLMLRPAGTMFERDGKIYRPTQNCSNSYGGSIVINCVTELQWRKFQRRICEKIKPDLQIEYPERIRAISEFGNVILIYKRRKFFVIYKPLPLPNFHLIHPTSIQSSRNGDKERTRWKKSGISLRILPSAWRVCWWEYRFMFWYRDPRKWTLQPSIIA